MRHPARRRLLAAAVAAALVLPGCGKKAPLRLPDSRPADQAAKPRARVREGRLRLDFEVPRHRMFPEIEEPWVLARVLRQAQPDGESVEVAAILEKSGFAFGAGLQVEDAALAAGAVAYYRVEFRDAAKRRRALSEPLAVSWSALPPAPAGLLASGAERAVTLRWDAVVPAGARYRLYRGEGPGAEAEAVFSEAVAATSFTDSRVDAGRVYCYAVRAVLVEGGIEVEGPASAGSCTRTEGPAPPPESPPR